MMGDLAGQCALIPYLAAEASPRDRPTGTDLLSTEVNSKVLLRTFLKSWIQQNVIATLESFRIALIQ